MRTAALLFRARRLARASEGATPVELALVILLFVFVIYGIYKFAFGMYMWNSLTLAAQEGGRNAMIFNSDYSKKGCDDLWTNYVQPKVVANLPGPATDYTYHHSCAAATSTTPATMTIAITYSLSAGGTFGSLPRPMSLRGFALSGWVTVPLD